MTIKYIHEINTLAIASVIIFPKQVTATATAPNGRISPYIGVCL